MNTANLTAEQVRHILGPKLAERAERHGNVYHQVRAGLLREAIGTLSAGARHKQIDRYYAEARERQEALLAGIAVAAAED